MAFDLMMFFTTTNQISPNVMPKQCRQMSSSTISAIHGPLVIGSEKLHSLFQFINCLFNTVKVRQNLKNEGNILGF